MNWATNKKDVSVSIKLLNKGTATAKNITAKLSATKNNANVITRRIKIWQHCGERNKKSCETHLHFIAETDSIEIEKFKFIYTRMRIKMNGLNFLKYPTKKTCLK